MGREESSRGLHRENGEFGTETGGVKRKKKRVPVFLMLVKLVLREGGINIRVKKGFLA